MKHTLISGLGIFVVLPAIAGARLPAVNMAAGAISARAQYGEVAEEPTANKARTVKTISARKLIPINADGTVSKKNVVPRNAKKKSAVIKNTGDKVAARSEYLTPNRPSSDLWATSDAPLRMPHADEFSVLKSDFTLPEENLGPVASAKTRKDDIRDISNRVSTLDSQLARLIDLQAKAEAAAKSNRTVSKRSSIETSVYPSESVAVNFNNEIASHESHTVPSSMLREGIASDGDINISRMVVARDDLMDDDVVVRSVKKNADTKIQDVRDDMTKMSPSELRRAFRKTFLSENKHLSTYSIDDKFDVASDMSSSFEGFTSARDLSEDANKIRPLEIKIRFRNADSALSRDNYNLLSEYAGVVVSNPKRAIQIAIPEMLTTSSDARKLTARRLAIIEQVLRDTGVAEQRIVPVLSNRDEEGFVLRIISNEQYETLTRQKRNMFGDKVSSKTYKSMTW